MKIIYSPKFIRQFKKLIPSLQEEILEKIEFFKLEKNHKVLRVHKLHGDLKGSLSFSVNYQYRIVFEYIDDKKISFLAIGDHDIYK